MTSRVLLLCLFLAGCYDSTDLAEQIGFVCRAGFAISRSTEDSLTVAKGSDVCWHLFQVHHAKAKP